MAKFRDSASDPVSIVDGMPAGAAAEGRSIGHILAELRHLSAEQVERVLSHQQKNGLRFGEAAVALGLATRDDVLQALSQQFDYAYLPELSRQLSPELVALSEPFGPQAESFRALRTQLSMRFFQPGQARRALAVISPESGDGRTYSAANLAVSIAQLGGRTLLVDADLRRPRLHELFKAEAGPGLSGLLAGRADERVIRQVAAVPSLYLLSGGTVPPNPLELLERPAFGLLMHDLLHKFDHVVVDTAAAVHGADGFVAATRCGGALLVARRHGRVGMLQEMAASLAGSTAQMAGVLVNEH
jgi:chain length determinant protein tyrosine kinase EpsG